MVSAWRNFQNIFPRPLFIIIFRPEMLKFHPYSILTGDTRVEFVIYCVLKEKYFLFQIFQIFCFQEEDEDFAVYGSRCSLSSPNEKPGTSEVSEDEDMGGSRNSLSGLKRWTTEENLSMNESGSQIELMDTPLHDSHSNSTGTYSCNEITR